LWLAVSAIRLFFMIVQQQPFADSDVATAISNNITHKISLEHNEFKNSPKLFLNCTEGPQVFSE
jgi:hypothetical protein